MKKDGVPKVRLQTPNREQQRLVPLDLEGLLAEDHQARAVWAYVEQLDLSAFYDVIRSREGSAGRPAVDPKILLSLWLYATLDGVGSAREVERLTKAHVAYQWICGGVEVGYHTLSDFRSLSADKLNQALAESVALLINEGLVELRSVAHDGMKVRASAGASSFRTESRLRKFEKIAREQVERLASEIDDDPAASRRRVEARRQQAAESRLRRVQRAVKHLAKRKERKRSNNGKKKTPVRVSTTDPDAHVMKMPDGGFRPAFNVHLVSEVGSQIVVAFDVNDVGTDRETMVPLIDQVKTTYGKTPDQWLADGGCVSHANVTALEERGCEVYAPLMKRRSGRRRNTAVRTDTPAIKRWRKRMSTKDGKTIYKQRGATAECVNAQLRNNGLRQFLVRGIERVTSVVLLHILTHNMRRTWALTPI